MGGFRRQIVCPRHSLGRSVRHRPCDPHKQSKPPASPYASMPFEFEPYRRSRLLSHISHLTNTHTHTRPSLNLTTTPQLWGGMIITPIAFLSRPESRIGCVLCGDDGGLYLLFVKKGRRREKRLNIFVVGQKNN
jgi:hypothetical protein